MNGWLSLFLQYKNEVRRDCVRNDLKSVRCSYNKGLFIMRFLVPELTGILCLGPVELEV